MNLWLAISWMAVFFEKIVENMSNTHQRWNVKQGMIQTIIPYRRVLNTGIIPTD